MRNSNYDKFPSTTTDGKAVVGWDMIVATLEEAWRDEPLWAIDLYCGTYEDDFFNAFVRTGRKLIDTRQLMFPETSIRQLTDRFMTDDVLFGYMSNVKLSEYFDMEKVKAMMGEKKQEPCIIIGTGAAYIAEQWSMANAQWSMLNDQCSMFNGQCSMLNAKCSMLN